MSETLSVFQWSILALAALCIGMSKTGVQGMMLLVVPYMAMAFKRKAVRWRGRCALYRR